MRDNIYFYEKRNLLMTMLPEGSDGAAAEKALEEMAEGAEAGQDKKPELLLCLWKEHDEVRGICSSSTGSVRAKEFLSSVFFEKGLCRGDDRNAEGSIRLSNILPRAEERGIDDIEEFFRGMVSDYFENTDEIRAGDYAMEHGSEIQSLKIYAKKHVPWAFVKTKDIAPEGTGIRVRSLENDAGSVISSGDSLYIMIGIKGEVYYIDSDKFEKTYYVTDEPFDIFSLMTEFIPEVSILPGEEYISIDEKAHICYPRDDIRIYAKVLDRKTKIFPEYDRDNYFLGFPGDYMVARTDDISDIYIIQKEIFPETYEEAG